jgi:hypothetical protein
MNNLIFYFDPVHIPLKNVNVKTVNIDLQLIKFCLDKK